jgi:hypothetical protein
MVFKQKKILWKVMRNVLSKDEVVDFLTAVFVVIMGTIYVSFLLIAIILSVSTIRIAFGLTFGL